MRRTSVFVFLMLALAPAAAIAERTTVTVLATTDLHGYIYPIDYVTGRPVPRGFAELASLIREQRAADPGLLLIDCGDTIQGSPLEYVYQTIVRTGQAPLDLPFDAPQFRHDPMMLAMNALGYDAMAVGNHEYNYGLKNLNNARADARFPWLSANTTLAPGSGEKPYDPYVVKTVHGIKVAVIGVTTPAVPTWEKPENYDGYRFGPAGDAVRNAVAALRRTERPDLVVVAAHMGLGRDLKTGAVTRSDEDQVYDIAGVEGVDAIVFGHTHRQLEEYRIGGVLVTQPKNWGGSMARLEFEMERQPGGTWKAAQKSSRLLAPGPAAAADPEVLRIAGPYHDLAERYLATPVAESAQAMNGGLCRVEDTPLIDAIQEVELFYAKADVSLASCFNPRVSVPKGGVTVRQIAALYPYDNELYAVEATGRMIKDALENAARYFHTCAPGGCEQGRLVNPKVVGYNFDMAEGVEYEIDLTRPEGDRIVKLQYRGQPLAADRKLRLAVNNYRAAGSAGYRMFSGARVLWRSGDDIRDLIIRYYTERKKLPGRADGNWRIVPAGAVRALQEQAEAVGAGAGSR